MKTIAQAANFEAMVQLVQIGVRKLNDFVYMAPSETEADHVVTVNPTTGEAQSCTCKWFCEGGWTREVAGGAHKCKHALAVQRVVAAEKAEAEVASIAAAIMAVDAIVAEDEQEAEVVAAVAEAQAIVTATKPAPEYVRLASGGLVQKSAQKRYRWRGTFD